MKELDFCFVYVCDMSKTSMMGP